MTSTPPARSLWIFKRHAAGTGRKHMFVFIPNAAYADFDPSTSQTCTGTVIHVIGSPLLGFYHEFKRNYNPASDALSAAVESYKHLGLVEQIVIPEPSHSTFSTNAKP